MYHVVPIEHSQQAFHRPRRVALSRLNIFAKDAPSVLKGTHERIMVGTIHNRTQLLLSKPRIQNWSDGIRSGDALSHPSPLSDSMTPALFCRIRF
jgi:hypothetical protein